MRELFEQLDNYSLSGRLYNSYIEPKEPTDLKKPTEPKDETLLLTKNSYFWMYYVSKYGADAKMDLTNESKEKIEQIEEVRKNTHILKEIKYKRVTFEEDLMYSKDISVSTLKVLCIMNKLSVLIIKNKCYYFFNYGTTTHLLEKNKCTFNITRVKEIESNYYLLDAKPLKAISYYKLKELREIGTKFGIDIDVGVKSRLKKEIYDDILIKLIQMI